MLLSLRSNTGQNRTEKEERGLKRRDQDGTTIETVTGNACKVLALVVVAAIAKRRFEGGWVGTKELKEHTAIGKKPENLARALCRALTRLRKLRDVQIEDAKAGRSRHARLISPVTAALRDWLTSTGKSELLKASWESLVANAPALEGLDRAAQFGFMEAVMGSAPARLDVSGIYALLGEPKDSSDADEWCHIARLYCLRVESALAHRGPKELTAGRDALEAHLDREVKAPSPERLLVEAQAYIMIARSILAQAMAEKPEWPLDERRVAECRGWLSRAESAVPTVPSIDRGYALALEGLLCVHEGSLPPFPPEFFDDAAKLFQQALQQFRYCRNVGGILEVLHYEFERVYQRWLTTTNLPFAKRANVIRAYYAKSRSLFDMVDNDDLRIIGRARMVVFSIIVATHDALPSDTPAVLEAFRTASNELRELHRLATPRTAPFVAHAHSRLHEFASAFSVSELLDPKEAKPKKG